MAAALAEKEKHMENDFFMAMEEEKDDATAFTDMLLAEIRAGNETVESLKALQETEAYLFRLAGKDPETSAFHAAISTVLYILKQEEDTQSETKTHL